MTIRIRIKELLSCRKAPRTYSTRSTGVDVREEYANAFRTESYNEFWTRVLVLGGGRSNSHGTLRSTTADRLPSYRLFVEHLLDPDQPTVNRVLESVQNHPENHSLLSDYFLKTADASLLCVHLLKDIDYIRVKYRSLKTTMEALERAVLSPINHLPVILTRLTEFSNSCNPFALSASSARQIKVVQAGCTNLLQRIESNRVEARARLQLINKIKGGSTIFFVALTASVATIVLTHALALLVAAPSLIVVSLELASTRKLVWLTAQLDAAAKGTYILNRDLDTISRLVARVNDELEHMLTMVKFWLARKDARLQSDGEIMRQLKQNKCSFIEQLDELEEHLYMCFMTINRARNLLVKEIIDPGRPVTVSNM